MKRGVSQQLKPRFFGITSGTGEAVPVQVTARTDEALPIIRRMARTLAWVATVAGVLAIPGCGYHQVGAATHIPAGTRTIAVPIFKSNVQAYRTETVFTQAVVRELNTRTRYRVLTASGDGTFEGSGANADATLRGTILTQTIAPLTYDATSGQTSSYLVTITARLELVSQDHRLLWSNDAFEWHEQYQSTQDLSGFVQEDGAAVRRMAHDFAQAAVSDMLESFK